MAELAAAGSSPPNSTQESDLRAFAAARSHQDIASVHNFQLSLTNGMILICGGASVALLAFYGAVHDGPGAISFVLLVISLACYFFALAAALAAALYFKETVRYWAYIWQSIALGDAGRDEARFALVRDDDPLVWGTWLKRRNFIEVSHSNLETYRKRLSKADEKFILEGGKIVFYERHHLAFNKASDANRAIMISLISFIVGSLTVAIMLGSISPPTTDLSSSRQQLNPPAATPPR